MNSMNKKKNSSGFTLVELIVVMCLLGIIMGAVLNLIQPTARLYKNTNTYLNEEEAVTTIANFLEDDLTYATGVYIIASDNGDVNAVATQLNIDLAASGASPMALNNCILLDNVSVRQDTSKAIAKNSTGSVKKYALKSGTYVDVTTDPTLLQGNNLFLNSFALQDQTFLDDDKIRFGLSHSISGGSYAITVQMDVYRPEYSTVSDSYIYDEKTFSAQKAIEFVNLSAGVNTYTSVLNSSDGMNSSYIYIFYSRKGKISTTATNVKYECYVKDSSGNYQLVWGPSTAPEGSDISLTVQDKAESKNIDRIEPGDGYVYDRTGEYSTIEDDPWAAGRVYYDLTNLTSPGGGATVKLYAVYYKRLDTEMDPLTVTFYDEDQTSPIRTLENVPYGSDLSSSDIPSLPADTTNNGTHTRYTWADLGTTTEHVTFNRVTYDVNVYVYKYKTYDVTFFDLDGNQISWDDGTGNIIDHYEIKEGETLTSTPDKTPYMTQGGGNYDWDPNENDPITAPTEFHLTFTASATPDPGEGGGSGEPADPSDPSDPGEPAGGSLAVENSTGYQDYNSSLFHTIKITNLGSTAISGGYIVVTIEYNCNVSTMTNGFYYIGGYANSFTYSFSGKTLTLKFKMNEIVNSWDTGFPAGASWEMSGLQVAVPSSAAAVVSTTIEYSAT